MATNVTPRVEFVRWTVIGYIALLIFAAIVVIVSEDSLIRFLAFAFTVAFSFQFWTFATSRGERKFNSSTKV